MPRNKRRYTPSDHGEPIFGGHQFIGRKLELLASSVAVNLLMLAMPIMTLQVYDRVISHKNAGTMTMLTLGILVVVAMDTFLRLARSYVLDEGAAAFEFKRLRSMMDRTVGAWADQAQQVSIGEYVQALGAVARMKDYAAQRMMTLLVDIPFFLLFLGLIFFIGAWIVVAPLVLIALFGAMIWLTGKQLLKVLMQLDRLDTARYGYILETLRGIHTIKALGVEAMFARRFRLMLGRASRVAARVALLNQRLAAFGALFAQSVIIVVLASGAPWVIRGDMSLGGLIACVLLSGRLIQPLQHALMLWIHHQDYQQALGRMMLLETLMQQPCVPVVAHEDAVVGAIECRAVSFLSHASARPVLDDVHLSIAPGEAIALRGREDSGRGLFLKLLAGMVPPSRGVVSVSGMDPSTLAGAQLMREIAYLPSEAVLFRGTIMENLTGFHEPYETEAREIARLLGLDSIIARLPQGYETMLEGGNTEIIPPGLCQRIAIARALRHKPKVILFDRADRSLDRDGYQHVFNLLARLKGKATLVMVAEDENLIRLCDKVYLLEEGALKALRIRPIGRPRSNLGPLYQEMAV